MKIAESNLSFSDFPVNAAVFQAIEPKPFFEQLFGSKQKRIDSRKATEFRRVECVHSPISTCDSSTMISWGDTKVICGITAEIATPLLDSPSSGYIVPNVEISPMCSSKIPSGPPSEYSQSITNYLNQLFKSDNNCLTVLDLTQLCISEGEAVWCIYVDILVVNDDGCVADAALLAATNGLLHLELPHIDLDDGMVKINSKKPTRPLKFSKLPVSCSTALIRSTSKCQVFELYDPNTFEESISDTQLSFTFVIDPNLISVVPSSRASLTEFLANEHVESQAKRKSKISIGDLNLFSFSAKPRTRDSIPLDASSLEQFILTSKKRALDIYSSQF